MPSVVIKPNMVIIVMLNVAIKLSMLIVGTPSTAIKPILLTVVMLSVIMLVLSG
jgi:hypothetical protein